MSLRDLFLFGFMAPLVPMILMHPYIGALTWVWFGVMNPHRLTWGVAYNFQFSLVIAVLTVVGLLFTREHRKMKGGAPAVVLIAFMVWICVTALLPVFNPVEAYAYWERVMKIFVMTGVILLLLHTRRHVELLVWTVVVSLGFYGVKGGIFTILTGGNYIVWGPTGSVVAENNALAVGLVVIIPLMIHLYEQCRFRWLRWVLAGSAVLCAASILGSQSRGAFVGISAMICFLWVRSAHKLAIFISVLLFALIAIPAMPDRWESRMRTIETYQTDTSAMGRIVAWETAFIIAKDKFPIGAGFEYHGPMADSYSPDPSVTKIVAHSIYFQALGTQGFIGLAFFLLFWVLVWRQCAWIRITCRDHADLHWAFSLASMTQVSLVGYAVGGAFLNLAFWDLPYYLFAAVATTQYVVREELAQRALGSSAGPTPREAVTSGAKSYRAG